MRRTSRDNANGPHEKERAGEVSLPHPFRGHLGNDRQGQACVVHRVGQHQVIGLFAIGADIGALAEDRRNVGLTHEFAVVVLFRTLAVKRAVTAHGGHSTQNEGATNRNTAGIALNDE